MNKNQGGIEVLELYPSYFSFRCYIIKAYFYAEIESNENTDQKCKNRQ